MTDIPVQTHTGFLLQFCSYVAPFCGYAEILLSIALNCLLVNRLFHKNALQNTGFRLCILLGLPGTLMIVLVYVLICYFPKVTEAMRNYGH